MRSFFSPLLILFDVDIGENKDAGIKEVLGRRIIADFFSSLESATDESFCSFLPVIFLAIFDPAPDTFAALFAPDNNFVPADSNAKAAISYTLIPSTDIFSDEIIASAAKFGTSEYPDDCICC